MKAALADFHIIRPHYEVEQESALEWIAGAHALSEAKQNSWELNSPEHLSFYEVLKERLLKLGAGKDKVKKRGIHFRDVLHTVWEEMEIYPLQQKMQGEGHGARCAFFERSAENIFERFYPEPVSLPDHLIHVTCTGYTAPSGAQKLVSKRRSQTVVTHAYHMGCYAAMPAIRMGLGFFHTPAPARPSIDIVHTEICSLHMNPLLHGTDQLVVHSLFGDGFVKYSLMDLEKAQKLGSHFTILKLHEETIPDSADYMSWQCEDWGLKMTLAREVPVFITRSISTFIERLTGSSQHPEHTLFAIHPGGPKIIQQLASVLNLIPRQIAHSEHILQTCGNMSSATLPHIWRSILLDEQVPEGTQVISLAFGPGLSISGSLLQKEGKTCGP